MTYMNLKAIVLDERITPRADDEAVAVQQLCDAFDCGAEFAPMLVDKASKRLIDGRRRRKMYLKRKVERVPVKFMDFPGGLVEMLTAAIAANAAHGMRMDARDHLSAINKMEALGGTVADVAKALCVPVATLEELRSTRTAVDEAGEPHYLKPATRHLAGTVLSPSRVETNRHLPANPVYFLIDRVADLLLDDLVPHDEKHDAALDRLEGALRKRREVVPTAG